MSFFIVELISVLVSTLFTLFELLGYNGNKGHVFTKKPDLAFWVLTAISGIKFYFFKKFFLENLKLWDSSCSVCLSYPSPHNHAFSDVSGIIPMWMP